MLKKGRERAEVGFKKQAGVFVWTLPKGICFSMDGYL
jgi:hypothetical protein